MYSEPNTVIEHATLFITVSCVHLTDKWVELVICAFINHCSDLELTSKHALDLLHGICMGLDKLENGTTNRFVERDFIINWNINDPEPR